MSQLINYYLNYSWNPLGYLSHYWLLEAANHVQRNSNLVCEMQIRGGLKFKLYMHED